MPIIVFYILKVRLRRQVVSTNLFWKQIFDEKPPRSIWQYLRHLLSLLVQLVLLALLVLAVADPYLPWELLEARRIVLVVDRSASMQASDVSPTRFDAAIDSALTFVDSLRFRDELAIVSAGPEPEVVVGMTSHVPTLKRALHGLHVSDEPANLHGAVELGKQLVGSHPHGEVLVYTDGCDELQSGGNGELLAANDAKAAEPRPQVNQILFGTHTNNVGITQLQIRRSLVDPVGYEALIAVTNAGDEELSCRLELALNDVPVDVVPLHLKPNERWQRSLQKTSIEGGRFVATLTQIAPASASEDKGETSTPKSDLDKSKILDGLIVDDTAYAVLALRKPQQVLLVTEGNLFLQKVFEANPLVQCKVVKEIPKEWPKDAIVVLHREVPPTLPLGDVVVIEPKDNCDAWEIASEIENPIITQQETNSPLMAHLRLDNTLMPSAKRLTFKSPVECLAGTISGDTIYGLVKHDHGKCLVLSVDLDRSDLTFRTAFPIMMTNALNWFRGNTGELQSAVATGTTSRFPVDEKSAVTNAKLVLVAPDGTESEIRRHAGTEVESPAKGAESKNSEMKVANSTLKTADAKEVAESAVQLGPFDQCGIWKVVTRDYPKPESLLSEFAVNLANDHESDLRPVAGSAPPETAAVFAGGWFARPLWYYLAACADAKRGRVDSSPATCCHLTA